ncbi:MAG TPA: CBS domain-containing protein [Thermoanaerobaculia bacterium]|jgi:CBS domain-containing protein
MRVRDVMRTNVRTIQPTEPASAAKEMFRRYDIHHLVVVDRKDVVGLVADRDLMDVNEDAAVRQAMAHPVVTISPDETVRKAAALMTGHVIGSLPVVDDGKLVGIVTTFDLVALLAKGATHPAPNTERVVLAKRGPRPKSVGPESRRQTRVTPPRGRRR